MGVKKKAQVSKPKQTTKPLTPRRAKAAKRAPKREANRSAAASPAGRDRAMTAWHKAMTPAAAHQRLDPIVGKFRARSQFWAGVGAPPESGEGESDHLWVLGGRFIEQRYRGKIADMPFEGIGFTGFDNVQRKYVGSWIDTMGTGMMNSLGVGQPTNGEIAFVSEIHEPTGRRQTFRSIIRIANGDRHSYELWTAGPDGREFRTMLVEYTRV